RDRVPRYFRPEEIDVAASAPPPSSQGEGDRAHAASQIPAGDAQADRIDSGQSPELLGRVSARYNTVASPFLCKSTGATGHASWL
ncbi:MAG: hypothetical protein KDA61_21525, partial [Planctomycetales bacterium]|nr:hypothetical protein [Planctomycetales bacterium]